MEAKPAERATRVTERPGVSFVDELGERRIEARDGIGGGCEVSATKARLK
jgi:hypothetical protein